MAYTEIKERNEIKYFYRVKSIRTGKKFKKQRIYLGKDLSKEKLTTKEVEADNKLNNLNKLNSQKELKGLNKLKPKIVEILKKNKIKKAGIFGSYARSEERKDSDVDILVQPAKNMGFKFAGLEIQLTKALKKKVDLVSYNGLSPYLKSSILKQEVRII